MNENSRKRKTSLNENSGKKRALNKDSGNRRASLNQDSKKRKTSLNEESGKMKTSLNEDSSKRRASLNEDSGKRKNSLTEDLEKKTYLQQDLFHCDSRNQNNPLLQETTWTPSFSKNLKKFLENGSSKRRTSWQPGNPIPYFPKRKHSLEPYYSGIDPNTGKDLLKQDSSTVDRKNISLDLHSSPSKRKHSLKQSSPSFHKKKYSLDPFSSSSGSPKGKDTLKQNSPTPLSENNSLPQHLHQHSSKKPSSLPGANIAYHPSGCTTITSPMQLADGGKLSIVSQQNLIVSHKTAKLKSSRSRSLPLQDIYCSENKAMLSKKTNPTSFFIQENTCYLKSYRLGSNKPENLASESKIPLKENAVYTKFAKEQDDKSFEHFLNISLEPSKSMEKDSRLLPRTKSALNNANSEEPIDPTTIQQIFRPSNVVYRKNSSDSGREKTFGPSTKLVSVGEQPSIKQKHLSEESQVVIKEYLITPNANKDIQAKEKTRLLPSHPIQPFDKTRRASISHPIQHQDMHPVRKRGRSMPSSKPLYEIASNRKGSADSSSSSRNKSILEWLSQSNPITAITQSPNGPVQSYADSSKIIKHRNVRQMPLQNQPDSNLCTLDQLNSRN